MAVVQNYLPGDPLLIDKIVYELKSQGIFDQFRKECIADVDTKPAYQNLRQRVEGSVSGFLNKQKWSSDMNKNQLREMLRKNIYESGFLETGVERIVDQVVNPKINSIFLPKVTEVVYKFLGIEKPSTNDKRENLKLTFNNDNLLPTDLEAVSPESEKKFDISNDSQTLDSKIDEDESPPFEPLEEKPIFVPPEENSVDSHLSGFSGLISHDSNHSQEFPKSTPLEVSNQDSVLSKQSSEGRLSIVMSDDNDTKMEICEDSQQKTTKPNDTKLKTFDFTEEIVNNNTALLKKSESKPEEKSKSDKSKSHDRHKSRHDSKSEKKDDKDKKNDKDRKEHRDKHSSRDKGKEKNRKNSKNASSKTDKDKSTSKSDNKDSKSDSKSDKDKSKSSSSSSNRHSSSSKDKEKSSSSKKESSSSSKDRGDHKDRSKSSSSKDKDSKHRDDKNKSESKSNSKHESKSDKHKKDDKHRTDRHSSSSKSRDKDKKDSKKEKKENKDDHFSSKKRSDRRSTDRDSNDGQSGLKSSSSSFDSYVSSQTQSKGQESSNSNSNTGSGDSGNSDAVEKFSDANTLITILDEKVEEMKEVTIKTQMGQIAMPTIKLIKPKFASNIHEAKRLMKIRKQLSLLEKQNLINYSQTVNNDTIKNNKLKTQNKKKEYKKRKEQKKYKISNATVNNNRTLKQNNSVSTTSVTKKAKEPTPAPLSPPLKSAVVSAATWDALEAKLHESIDYSTCYDVVDIPESMEFSVNYNRDDCLYLELDSSGKTQRYIKFTTEYIANLEKTIKKQSVHEVQNNLLPLRNHANNVNKSLKRKFSDLRSDVKNNNKKFSTHHIEVHENFSLPLSPAESDNSIDKKSDTSETSDKSIKKAETEFLEKVKKTIRASAKTQRYSSEDLYKPRPVFGGSRRRAGRNLGLD